MSCRIDKRGCLTADWTFNLALVRDEVMEFTAKIVSVHAGSNDDLSKEQHPSIQAELDGIVGDRHRSYSRKTWPGDKQPEGAVRRNERQW